MDKLLHDTLEGLRSLASALLPAAIGAAVAQAWETGLTWSQRLVQWGVGISVSYYVTLGARAWLRLDPFMCQAVSFILAMVAFRATPRFLENLARLLSDAPATILGRLGIGPKGGGGAA
ncbi:hypothetical protein [Sphingomonas morindae]|uniref:Holin n=1 Tax=Sphingomonas morindae TaxID=1541170 RepID=A0ABY4X783_9SPHN|nr:hypothetical protein [Sphingomonas morindae]USI72720.1 hypothetical protein LHA26_15820 [Sphingomonas morindae]